jgi:Mg-chelatase subunit ChlI
LSIIIEGNITPLSNENHFYFPFTAIVGQETMKTALVLNALSPEIGGVLIRGPSGTAKSTAVRALASLLSHRTGAGLWFFQTKIFESRHIHRHIFY